MLRWISSCCAVSRCSSCISLRLRLRNRRDASLFALRFSAWLDEPDRISSTHGIMPGGKGPLCGVPALDDVSSALTLGPAGAGTPRLGGSMVTNGEAAEYAGPLCGMEMLVTAGETRPN
jgi:hypothetical protein